MVTGVHHCHTIKYWRYLKLGILQTGFCHSFYGAKQVSRGIGALPMNLAIKNCRMLGQTSTSDKLWHQACRKLDLTWLNGHLGNANKLQIRGTGGSTNRNQRVCGDCCIVDYFSLLRGHGQPYYYRSCKFAKFDYNMNINSSFRASISHDTFCWSSF